MSLYLVGLLFTTLRDDTMTDMMRTRPVLRGQKFHVIPLFFAKGQGITALHRARFLNIGCGRCTAFELEHFSYYVAVCRFRSGSFFRFPPEAPHVSIDESTTECMEILIESTVPLLTASLHSHRVDTRTGTS